jgi:folate-dependent phosphoribosylglycinamide formyltransferase PurN
MKVALLTSTEPRHCYMAHRLAAALDLRLVIREEKGLDTFYEGREDAGIITGHFARLKETELQFFGSHRWEDLHCEVRTVPRGALSNAEIAETLAAAGSEAVVVFGPGIIKEPLLSALPAGRTLNLHQGLSPYYRGSGTNFWPYLEGRLHCIGVTLHYLDKGIDTGGIIAHGRPDIEAHDTLHSLGCKTIQVSADLALRVLKVLDAGGALPAIVQWEGGRLFQRKDMNGKAVERLLALEKSGATADFLRRRKAGEIEPIRVVNLE